MILLQSRHLTVLNTVAQDFGFNFGYAYLELFICTTEHHYLNKWSGIEYFQRYVIFNVLTSENYSKSLPGNCSPSDIAPTVQAIILL